MSQLYDQILSSLQEESREKALSIALDALDQGQVSVVDLYEKILGPALNSIVDEYPHDDDLIWREHVRSGIVRGIVEAAYPHVLKERDRLGMQHGQKILLMTPEFEDHDLGARMASDFFTICGYDATFVGARTPIKTCLRAVEIVSPQFLSLSVTNFYNLISAKRMVERIKAVSDKPITFLLGGSAFAMNPNGLEAVGGHYLVKDYQDILDMSREVL